MDIDNLTSPLSQHNNSHRSSPLSNFQKDDLPELLKKDLRKSLKNINKEEKRLNKRYGQKLNKVDKYGKDRALGSCMDPTLSDIHG